MLKSSTARLDKEKTVACTQCGGMIQVARRAMSIFCPHCKRRLILENFQVKSYHASRLFATCGDIVVEKGGFVSAPIRVANLTVRGRVHGNVAARGLVTIASTGQIRGNIDAARLIVDGGATVNGFCRITPTAADAPA